ncbi:MAG: hypothetical protein KBT36_10990 [Kurthia sp.]|nr:hypothetical protein [Candidatus Kurthia equi]
MDIEFISPEFEHLKSPYYDDFSFQHVDIINIHNGEIILASDFQGKFLQVVWDALIEFEYDYSKRKIKQYGKRNFYTLELKDKNLHIEKEEEVIVVIPYDEFYFAYYQATKNYLIYVKRENARIVLEDCFQQLAASCSYYERKFALNE